MLTSSPKRFILPFSNSKSSSNEVEAASVFAFAESKRSKGGGFIARQPEEKLVCLSKVGYPLWLVPKNDLIFVFDGFNDSSQRVSFLEAPSVKGYMESLDTNSKPRENYYAFLLDHTNYFQKSTKEKQFVFRSLIVNLDFKTEFIGYKKEATEITGQVNVALLPQVLEESTITSMLSDFEKLQLAQRDEALKLPECVRLVNKTTGQYITELDYEAEAVTEEMDAKIRALEEFVNPQLAKINKDYKVKIAKLADRFDEELDRLQKMEAKTKKSIENNEAKIKQFEREAKSQATKNHALYEKRWKEKIKQTQKEVKELKKDLSTIEDNSKKLSKQKTQKISQLTFQLDSEVKLARQPLIDLQIAREAKIRVFKLEAEKLFRLEKPVLEDLSKSLTLMEAFKTNFEAIGFRDQMLKSPTLFYVPFLVVCYEVGLTRRYIMLAPSIISLFDFSARLKGTFGLSKTKDLLVPRFKVITSLISKVEDQTKQNSRFESQLYDLIQRNNLLNNPAFRENVAKGLSYLKYQGWFSDKEQQTLSNRLL
jgi:hypothetical protein